MKELSIEEKTKRYDELLLKLQKAKVDDNVCDEMYYRVIDDIVPELKESDDERIREALITAVSGTFKGKTLWHTDVTREEALVWLKKQGEQKQEEQPRYNIGDVICDKSCTTLNKKAQPNMEIVDIKNGMYICDKGSFPVSQQDEYELVGKKIDTKLNDDSVSNELRAASTAHAEKEIKNHTFPDNEEFELVYTFEEGAKWQATQKSSWSKDDDDNLGMIESRLIDLLSYTRKDNNLTKHRKNTIEEEVVGYVNWLTSLKARFTWKPSNEQMKELNYAVNAMASSRFARENDCCYNVLKTLRDQLEKLK